MHDELHGGIETGGTKFICAVSTSPDTIIAQTQIPTTSPDETLGKVIAFFRNQPALRSMGIASFGPLDLHKDSKTYGYITTTPKAGWHNTNVVGAITTALGVPVAIDTDVNCAAWGEQLYGAATGLENVAYVTVGTGIGIGSVVSSRILQGLTHTEMGHMLIPRDENDAKPSACPYHYSCLEGLASGTALRARWGIAAERLDNETAWEQEARYLAYGLVNAIVSTMPQRIVVGGGIMNHPGLIENIRNHVRATLNGYLDITEITDNIENYIVSPGLGPSSGITGALALASNCGNVSVA